MFVFVCCVLFNKVVRGVDQMFNTQLIIYL